MNAMAGIFKSHSSFTTLGTQILKLKVLMLGMPWKFRTINAMNLSTILTSNLSQSVGYNCSILSRYSFWACQRGQRRRLPYPRRAVRAGGPSWRIRPQGRRCARASTARPPRRSSPTQHEWLGSASPSTTATQRRAMSLSAPTHQPSTPLW